MDKLTARPQFLKQANFSLIRQAIMEKGTATRAEIVKETKISSTTVRSLLFEMLECGEIESIGFDESSGGRKAERYRIRPERYHSAVFCITDHQIHSLLIDVCGDILEKTRLEIKDDDFESVITAYLDDLTARQELRSVGIGVPGVVEGGCFWRQNPKNGKMEQLSIGTSLSRRYGLPVVLENDLNATAIGFARCYQKEFPCEAPDSINMVYLHFEKGCISAGIIAGGQVIRGSRRFAGELGLIPMEDERTLKDWLNDAGSDEAYTDLVVKLLGWICGILNPQYIVLGGPSFREQCTGPISDGLYAALPEQMAAEILYSPDVWRDYCEGMAYLTARKMFDDVSLIKE